MINLYHRDHQSAFSEAGEEDSEPTKFLHKYLPLAMSTHVQNPFPIAPHTLEEKGGDFERLSGELHSTVFRVSVSESRSVVG